MSSSGNKNYPATIKKNERIIFENTDSKFHIPEKYKNFYIVSKKDYENFSVKLESPEEVNPILRNEKDEILDFDTYTIDSLKGIEFLKNNILNKKKYVRSDEDKNQFVYKPETSAILHPHDISAVLNPIYKSALLNSIEKSAILHPEQFAAIFVKTKTNGGKKSKKSKKIRKHKGIIQIGGNAGRLQKGYKYSGKRLKNGMPEILKVKSVKK